MLLHWLTLSFTPDYSSVALWWKLVRPLQTSSEHRQKPWQGYILQANKIWLVWKNKYHDKTSLICYIQRSNITQRKIDKLITSSFLYRLKTRTCSKDKTKQKIEKKYISIKIQRWFVQPNKLNTRIENLIFETFMKSVIKLSFTNYFKFKYELLSVQ